MAKMGVARARIDAELKRNVEALLGKLGLSVSEAIRIYFRMIELNGGCRSRSRSPTTAAVFRDTDQGKNLKRFDDAKELFEDLGL